MVAFQRGEGDLFLFSLKAGGFGLNLTAAEGQDQGAPTGADELGALLRSNGRPTRGSGYSQAVSAESKCRANSMASCSTRPTTSTVGSKR